MALSIAPRREGRRRSDIGDRILAEAERGNHNRRIVDPLLEDWVHALCQDAQRAFLVLFKAHWPEDCDDELAERDLKNYLESWLLGTRVSESLPRNPEWPWPDTDATPGRKRLDVDFNHDQSALAWFGYRVGKTNGKPKAARQSLLSVFFKRDLPSEIAAKYKGEYGSAQSEERLRKMANVIAANCRNRKRCDAQLFREAIADWEDDLAFLKRTFYDNYYAFDWPETN